jgi:hypothetical protein
MSKTLARCPICFDELELTEFRGLPCGMCIRSHILDQTSYALDRPRALQELSRSTFEGAETRLLLF